MLAIMNENEEAGTPNDSLGKIKPERHEMKFITPAILASLLTGGSLGYGQNPDPCGPEGGPPHRPPPPIIAALDLNHDGVISADEIAKAAESLKKLDKNGDGQLTPDELRPPRPEGDHRPPGNQQQSDRKPEVKP